MSGTTCFDVPIKIVEGRFKGCNKPSEADIGLSLDHPNIVKTLGHGLSLSGQQFIILEYLEGIGLNSLLIGRSSALDGKRLYLIRSMADAIAALHKAGYIHRDICPRNFMVELETMSPLVTLSPGQSLVHAESWALA